MSVIPSRRIDFGELSFFGFDRLFAAMRWLPLVSLNEVFYTWLVKCFYSNMALEEGGPITTSMNGVEIKFDVDQLCEILGIENVRMKIYESKSWSKVVGFSPIEVV